MITRSANPWVVCPKPNPRAKLRLFCFPYAGGSAAIFHTWADDLPADIEFCAVQLPGHANRLKEPPFTRLTPLVQSLAQGLQPYLNIPFAFFGHSLGALIGFELTRHLRRNGVKPVHLFVSAYHAPQLPNPGPRMHDLPEAEFIDTLRLLNGIPQEILRNPELMQLFAPLLRADFAINGTYTYMPEPPLDCPVSAFGGQQDVVIRREHIEAWRTQTRSMFALRMFPGDHFFLHTARTMLLQALSEDLRQCLEQMGGSKTFDGSGVSVAPSSIQGDTAQR